MNHGEWDAWCPASGVRILKSSPLSLHLVLTIVEIVVVVRRPVVSDSCDPMDCSTQGFPVLYYLLEFTQTHVL